MGKRDIAGIREQFMHPPELVQMILDGLEAGVMFIDTEYNIVFMNREKRDNNPDVRPGMKCYEVFEEYGMRCPFCVAHKAMELLEIQRNEDYVSIQKGVEVPVHLNITVFPVTDSGGRLLGAIEIAYNVENIYQTTVRLERLNKEYEHVIYALSHDLRAPLVSIEGFLAKLVRGKHVKENDEVADHCMDRIHANVRMMNNLVKVLLDTSRIATGKLEIQEVDMQYIAESVVEQFRNRIKEKGVTVTVVMETRVYMCDRIRVQQVFSNLIENSLEHSKNVKHLYIEIGSRKNTFWVKDTGPGIPDGFRERAFEAFAQAGDSGTDHFGMGMSIVYKIIQKHGGKVWIESTEGRGTTVFFTLRPL
ncbi:MAG: HAMP domain-containing histidine kinase [Spirochaetales bacterium]|nr:HAMP domain-containing histidine kinase [Spirochaetales bacterium]